MEPDLMEEKSPVRSIHYLPKIQRVCVAMHNGRLFLCDADVIPSSQSGGEGTFLVTELGAESCIHSLASMIPSADKTLPSRQRYMMVVVSDFIPIPGASSKICHSK